MNHLYLLLFFAFSFINGYSITPPEKNGSLTTLPQKACTGHFGQFIGNHGQWEATFLYKAITRAGDALLEKDGLTRSTTAMPLADLHNYYRGNDPFHWESGIHPYRTVDYKNIYKDIDLHPSSSEAPMKYDLITLSSAFAGLTGVDTCTHLYISGWGGKPFFGHLVPCIIDPTVVFATLTGSTADNWGFTTTYALTGNFYARNTAADNEFIVPTYTGGTQDDMPHSLIVDSWHNYRDESTSEVIVDKPDTTYVGGSYDDALNVTRLNTRSNNTYATTIPRNKQEPIHPLHLSLWSFFSKLWRSDRKDPELYRQMTIRLAILLAFLFPLIITFAIVVVIFSPIANKEIILPCLGSALAASFLLIGRMVKTLDKP